MKKGQQTLTPYFTDWETHNRTMSELNKKLDHFKYRCIFCNEYLTDGYMITYFIQFHLPLPLLRELLSNPKIKFGIPCCSCASKRKIFIRKDIAPVYQEIKEVIDKELRNI